MRVRESDLTKRQLDTLKRLQRGGPYLNIDQVAVRELKELGLVEDRLGGPAPTQEGSKALMGG